MRRPFLVGLTGNFGTGKSTVARFFRGLGARVLSADRLAHETLKKENPLYPRIRSLFGPLKGSLNRAAIARVVFRDSKKRRSLESLIHPYVFRRIEEEIARSGAPVVVVEIPLLFESGFHRQCDCSLVVKAPAEEVLRRLRRKGWGGADVKARRRAQRPIAEKIRRAGYVIDNSNGLERTRRQVVRIWKMIERSSKQHGKRES